MMIAIVIIGIIIRGIWLLTGAWGLNKLADAAAFSALGLLIFLMLLLEI